MPGTGKFGKRTLLVVEDDPDTANLLRLYFTGHGYEVLSAARGSTALEIARKQPLDLILLDIVLPEMDGYAVCDALRESPRTAYLPIIFLTEKSAPSERKAGLSAGAQDYVTKPFDLEELRLRVQNLIARAERENLMDPRTGLPTGRLIDEQLRRLAGQPGWWRLDCQIEAFRPFVDLNGFAAGDDVLKFAARLLREVLRQAGTHDDFLGHPANDTFLVLTAAADVPGLAARLQERFNTDVQAHYSFTDREQGHVLIRGSDGQMIQAPLMTLSVTTRAL
jgi:CheY-like chemotaxis protein